MHRRGFIHSLLATFGIPPVGETSGPRPPATRGERAPYADNPASSPLETWLQMPIQPVWRRPDLEICDAPDHLFHLILRTIRNHESLTIRYNGGTRPGLPRSISPALVFHKLRPAPIDPTTEPHHVLAWCHLRNELRTFRLDRMQVDDPTGFSLDILVP